MPNMPQVTTYRRNQDESAPFVTPIHSEFPLSIKRTQLPVVVYYVICSAQTGNNSPAKSDGVQIQYKPTVQPIMVSNNQVEQYFQFIKDMLFIISSNIISEPLVHSAYYMPGTTCTPITTCLLYHSGVEQSNTANAHDSSIHSWVVLSEISQMSLATCSLLCKSRSHK